MAGRITYVGHGTTLLELAGVRLLTDPLLRDRFLHVRRHSRSPDPAVARDIDAVLISHMHADHLDPPSLRKLGDVQLIVPKGAAGMLHRRGLTQVTELIPGAATAVGDLEITATRAVHDGRRWKIGRRVPSLGYLIETPDMRAFFAGDTDLFDEMSELAPVDVALLPVAGWGSREALGWGHLDSERAAIAAARLGARTIVPIHWGTFASRQLARRRPKSLTHPPPALARHVAERAPDAELRVLDPGESLEL